MAERCPACAAHVDDGMVVAGGVLRCEKCGMRFPRPRRAKAAEKPALAAKDDLDGLGIHPALARKYRRVSGEGAAVSLPEAAAAPVGGGAAFDRSALDPARGDPARAEPPTAVEPALGGRRASLEGQAFDGHAAVASIPEAARLPAAPPPVPSGRVDAGAGLERAPPPPAPHTYDGETPIERRAPPQKKGEKPAEPLPVVPGYDILELVGKGAMGRVWKGRNQTTGELAAIKVLAPELAARQDFIQRFEREAAAIRAVDHPGVVAILDAGRSIHGEAGSQVHDHYFCMEFLEGQPLRKKLDRGALPTEIALRYARLIVQGLGAAHKVGVIHRDLKPENILVVADDSQQGGERLVLVDFGLAGIVDEENDPHPNLTKSRMTMGTVNYMAPEQRTDAKRVDHRADLYAAGVILYELLTGDLPLGRFALPTERGLPLPRSVDDCIVRALARNPDERFQDAEHLDAALAAIEDELRRAAGMDTVLGRHDAQRPQADGDGSDVPAPPPLPPAAVRPPPTGGGDTPVTGRRVRVLAPIEDDASFAGARDDDEDGSAMVSRPPFVQRSTMIWSVAALALGTIIGLAALQRCDDAPEGAGAAPGAGPSDVEAPGAPSTDGDGSGLPADE